MAVPSRQGGLYRLAKELFVNISHLLLFIPISCTDCEIIFMQERLKRRRKEEYERQCEELEKREQLHNEIDRNLDKLQQKEKDAKQVPYLS